MPLVTDLGVSLMDFLPKEGGQMISIRDDPAATVISDRLYRELQSYAKSRLISLSSALEQLRDEIHEAS